MAPIFAVFLVIALLLFVFYRVKCGRRIELFAKIPSPPKTLFLHNTPQMFRLPTEKLLKTFVSWHHTYGDVYHVTLHTFDDGIVVVADTKIAEALSQHQPERSKAMLYQPLSRWIGRNGFFLSKGEPLKGRMKMISNYFSPKMFDMYLRAVNKQIVAVSNSDILCGDNVDFYSFTRKMALDLVFEIIMGFNLNSKNDSNLQYVDAIEEISKIAMRAAIDPISRYDLLHPFTNLYREETKVLTLLHGFTRKIVQDRRKELELNEIEFEEFSVLNHYIQTQVDGQYLTDEEIREELDTMILGAHDTTKSTTAFIMYNLAKHPEIQQKVYDEAYLLLKDDVNIDLDTEDLLRMPYLDSVIKETLRLYPPVPFVCRKLDSEITTGGFTFPKNVDVFISPFLAGRNSKYFDDPLVFNPNRFYENKSPPPGYIPFSIGARKCMGGGIAILILKIIISKFVIRYKTTIDKGHENVALSMDLILGPVDGIYLNIHKR